MPWGATIPGGVADCVHRHERQGARAGHDAARTSSSRPGLSDENVASPEDLSKLVIAAAKVPTIREYSTDSEHVVQVGRRTMQLPQHRLAGEQVRLEHRGAEDRLHRRGRPLPGDADRHRGAHRGHRAAEFLRQAHPRGRCPPHAPLDGDDARLPRARCPPAPEARGAGGRCQTLHPAAPSGARLDAAQVARGGDPRPEPAEHKPAPSSTATSAGASPCSSKRLP